MSSSIALLESRQHGFPFKIWIALEIEEFLKTNHVVVVGEMVHKMNTFYWKRRATKTCLRFKSRISDIWGLFFIFQSNLWIIIIIINIKYLFLLFSIRVSLSPLFIRFPLLSFLHVSNMQLNKFHSIDTHE